MNKRTAPKSFDAGRAQHGRRLFEALGHDMVQVWSPTVDNYLGRVCKERFLEAVREGVQLGKFAFSDAKRHFSTASVRLGKARAEQNESALPPSSGHKCRFCRKSASGMADLKAPAFDPQKFAKLWMMLSSGTTLAFQPLASM